MHDWDVGGQHEESTLEFKTYFIQIRFMKRNSLPNDISTPIVPSPNLVNPSRINIHPVPDAVFDLFPVVLFRIPQGQLALGDQMRGQAGM